MTDFNLDPEYTTGEPTAHQRRRPSRVAAIAASAALVAGLGGFFVGHSAGSPASKAKPAAESNTSSETAGSNPTATPSTAAPAPPYGASASDSKSAISGGGGGQYSQGAYPEEPLELLGERTTPTGITLRAHRQVYGVEMMTPYGDQFGGWTPAGWCFPTGNLRISISTSQSVNLGWAPWYTEPKGGVAVSTVAGGYVEGSPVFGAVVQVGADATSVTFTTASGLTDSTAPSNGIALLAVNGPIEENFSVVITNGDGSSTTLSSADLTSSNSYDDSGYRQACEPPPPVLPPAGEQPADPAAAEAAVRAAWALARDFGAVDPDVRASYIEDTTGIAEAWDAVNNGEFAEAAKGSTSTITELVFTSPTEAWFRYDITSSIVNYNDRYGIAHLSAAGVWQFTRQTVCQDLQLVPNAVCSPAVDTLYPPSAANDPRYGGGIVPIEGGVGVGISGEGDVAVTPPCCKK